MVAWRFAFDPRLTPDSGLRDVLVDALRRCAGHLPAILRLDVAGSGALAVPVPSRRPAALIASRFSESVPELSVLQHASTVAALELEKLVSHRDAQGHAGAELFGELVTLRASGAQAAARLHAAGLDHTNLVVAAWWHSESSTGIHYELSARGIPHLVRAQDRDSIALALIPGDRGALTLLLDVLPGECVVGVSAGVEEVERVPGAAREARWALHGAGRRESRVLHYTEGRASSWTLALERSEELAEHVVGPLLDYDRIHHTELVRTLAVLLRNNRSSTRTAQELFIHRQTLVYRMRRIEELTSRSLSSTEDVVELWLGLRAVEVIDGSVLLGTGG
jgi:purine catabolism regulator